LLVIIKARSAMDVSSMDLIKRDVVKSFADCSDMFKEITHLEHARKHKLYLSSHQWSRRVPGKGNNGSISEPPPHPQAL